MYGRGEKTGGSPKPGTGDESRRLTWQELKKEAFGGIGLHPAEFYEMEFIDFMDMRDGWLHEKDQERLLVRTHAALIMSTQAPGQKVVKVVKEAIPVEGDALMGTKPKKMVEYKGLMITEHQYLSIQESIRKNKEKLKQKANGN